MRSIELIELLYDPIGRESYLSTIAMAKQLYRRRHLDSCH